MCDYGLQCGSQEDPDKMGLGCFPGTTVPFCLVSRLLVPHLSCHPGLGHIPSDTAPGTPVPTQRVSAPTGQMNRPGKKYPPFTSWDTISPSRGKASPPHPVLDTFFSLKPA